MWNSMNNPEEIAATNAHLLKAAPELVRTCRDVLDFLEHRKDDLKHLGEAQLHRERLQAAIAATE